MKALNPVEFIRGLRGILDGKVYLPESLHENPVLHVLLRRRSVRKFEKKDIPEDVFRAILEAARVAPCAINLQSIALGIFDRGTWKSTFGRSIPFDASRAVMVMGDIHRARSVIGEIDHYPLVEYTLSVMNASIAAYAMNIAAESCGVASVMLSETGKSGFYDAKYLKEKLNLPDGVFPILTIVFGFPKGKPPTMPPKLPIEEITFSGTYKEAGKKTMKEWLQQMIAGYRAWRITDSFQRQVKRYVERADAAEESLKELVFYKLEE